MRPRGELREVLRAAAEVLAPAGSAGVTWRVLVRHACVGELMGRRTVENMVRDGELVLAGRAPAPGVCRPMNLYAVPVVPRTDEAASANDAGQALASCWASARAAA